MKRKIKKLLDRIDELFTEYEFAKMQNDDAAVVKINEERNLLYLNINALLIDTLQSSRRCNYPELQRIKKLLKMEDLCKKLKSAIIADLSRNELDMDSRYMRHGNKSYTKRQLIAEIENETDFGIRLFKNVFMLSLDMLARRNS